MRVIKPRDIVLHSSNVAASGLSEWSESETYGAGDQVKVTLAQDGTAETPHKIFKSLVGNNKGLYPPLFTAEKDATRISVGDTDDAATFTLGELISTDAASGRLAKISGTTGGALHLVDVSGEFFAEDSISGGESGASVTASRCTTTTVSAFWKEVGATNRWAMFDEMVNTQTEKDMSIEFEIDASRCDSLALFAVEATEVCIALINNGTGEIVFSETRDMRLDSSVSWSDYFFGDFEYRYDVLFAFPMYYNATLDIQIRSQYGIVKCGHVIVGRGQYVGATQFDFSVGIKDFSEKDTNDSGVTTFKRRDWAKRMNLDLQVNKGSVDKLQRLFANLRGSPAVWQGNNEDSGYESLLVYGFFADFEVVVPGPVLSSCSLEIKGLI